MKQRTLYLTLLCNFLSIALLAQIGNTRLGNQVAPNFGTSSPIFANYLTAVGDSTGFNLLTGQYITVIGKSAGFSLNNDSDNTILGAFANYKGTTGVDNVIIGARAGYHNNGSDNTFIGNQAGFWNTTGFDNTFIGEDAGEQNTTGSDNVYIGEDAGHNNTTGSDNVFIGAGAGRQNRTGNNNTAIGHDALFDLGSSNDNGASYNTAVGDSTGIDVGEGQYNTLIGASAGPRIENASFNTFVGYRSGYSNNFLNTTGNRNAYLGSYCGQANRIGEDNAGLGHFADFRGQNPNSFAYSRNTFMGSRVQVWNADCVAMGYNAIVKDQYGIAIGSTSIVDGNSSIAIGFGANIGDNNNQSVALGHQASVTATNSIAIGYQAAVASDNEVAIGNASIASIGGVVNWTATSDGRFKTDVREDVGGLNFINKLRPVTYNFDARKLHNYNSEEEICELEAAFANKETVRYTGFIAQEVAAAAEESGFEFSGVDTPENEDDIYGLRYAEFSVPLVKAVQELDTKVKEQKEQIEQLLSIVQAQQLQNQSYEKLISDLNLKLGEVQQLVNTQKETNTPLVKNK